MWLCASRGYTWGAVDDSVSGHSAVATDGYDTEPINVATYASTEVVGVLHIYDYAYGDHGQYDGESIQSQPHTTCIIGVKH